jgi:hypothetical protein
MKRQLLVIAFVVFSCLLIIVSCHSTVNEWRKPTTKDLADNLDWRKEDPQLYLVAKSDFDGDGETDIAELLINDKNNRMGLFVKLSNQPDGEPIKLEEFDGKVWIEVIGIEVAGSGEYRTACGKGYFDCREGEPEILILKMPAINLFNFEGANSFFVWDEKNHKFKRIWMSD